MEPEWLHSNQRLSPVLSQMNPTHIQDQFQNNISIYVAEASVILSNIPTTFCMHISSPLVHNVTCRDARLLDGIWIGWI
jgi:hypothetical protein